ncbi:hypothetical protein [Niastella sp. OAS944]|uniref:hypothetical protein n=1 Tax=Niastella sp. OAS944 TaxID=2664089 RepID=UPI00348B2B4F|nr:hypothetical protein [Chitinophagaceae bacterium OAS944]
MTNLVLREKLHKFIDSIGEKKVKAIYTLFENEIEQEVEYSEEFKAELDKRVEYYRNGGKMVSASEMKKRLKAIRSKGSK